MAIWKEHAAPPKDAASVPQDSFSKKEPETRVDSFSSAATTPRRPSDFVGKESLIAEEITIEGKIEGTGHVRIAGRFKGDVHVQGNLSIEQGATLTGGVRANTVTIAGQLEGNIDSAARVELLETGVLNGDLSAESLTVAAGSRMRGRVEFGWQEKPARPAAAARDRSGTPTTGMKVESGSAA